MMAEKITEMKICKDCSIVVTDSRTGSSAVFTIGDLEPVYKGMAPQLMGSDNGGLGYRISVEYHEEETETKKKAEKFDRFLKEADKEVVFDIGSSQHLVNQMNAIQKACRQMDTIDVAHKDDELAKLPRRILQILGAS